MNRDSKNISSSLRPQIETIKSNIRNSKGTGFDGTGYPFKQALKELRAEGLNIKHVRSKCHYILED